MGMDFLFLKLDDTNLTFKVISIQGLKFKVSHHMQDAKCKKKPGSGCKRLFVADCFSLSKEYTVSIFGKS